MAKMSDPAAVAERSLGQLKNLDGLPELASQLNTARRLCNHSARAEMILRWLMGKMKASSEAKQSELSWDVMASAIRLLSTQRTSTVLVSGDLLQLIQTAVADPELKNRTMASITRVWQLLYQRGHGAGGAAVLSLLGSVNAVAAAIYGDWMRRIQRLCEEEALSLLFVQEERLLDVGLQVWELRKRQPSDDALFNAHCLLPASVLLAYLQSHEKDALKHKRKYVHDTSSAAPTYIHALESAVAKHTILPTRLAFFGSSENGAPRSHCQSPDLVEIKLEHALNTVGQALLREDSAVTFNAVSVILDIALRSVPTPTPRQRMQERPWLERVFSVLRSLMHEHSESGIRTVAGMLQCFRHRRASLPSNILIQMVSECMEKLATVKKLEEKLAMWDLVTEIVALEPGVTANATLAEQILSNIDAFGAHRDAQSWERDIVLPMIKAFAQNRDIVAVIELWHRRLQQQSLEHGTGSLWSSLVPSFSRVFGSTQTADQALTCLERYLDGVDTADLSTLTSASKLQADCIVLAAMIQGLNTDDFLDKCMPRLELARQRLFQHREVERNAPVSCYSALWQCLTALVEACLPAKIASERKASEAAAICRSMLESDLLKVALRQCKKSSALCHAQMFIACICDRYCRYQGHGANAELCQKAIEALCKQPSWSVFARYQNITPLVGRETLVQLVHLALGQSHQDSRGELSEAALNGSLGRLLDALIASARVESQQEKKASHSDVSVLDLEELLTSLLSGASIDVLDAKQRANVLNIISNLSALESLSAPQLMKRLAVVLALLQYPCEGAELLEDSSTLWSITQCLKDFGPEHSSREHNQSYLAQEEVIILLSKIVETVVIFWSKSKVQHRDKLLHASSRARQALEQCTKGRSHSRFKANILVAGAVVGVLETTGDALATEYEHRRSHVLQKFWAVAVDSGVDLQSMIFALDALLAIPRSASASLASETDAASRKIMEIILHGLSAESPSTSPLSLVAAARAVRLFCRYAAVEVTELINVTEKVLQHHLSAPDHIAVLKDFETRLQSASSRERASAVEKFLKDGPRLSSQALDLQQCAVKALVKEDLGSSGLTTLDIYHHILQQLLTGNTTREIQLSLQTIKPIMKERSFMVNQFGVEQTVWSLQSKLGEEEADTAIYLDICQVSGLLLTQHHGRLQGRYHLMVPLFQQLITSLLHNGTRPTTPVCPELPQRQATALARLLETFCNPPHVRKRNELVDEVRKAKAYAGQYVQYILHHYCSQILSNPPTSESGIRQALLPGIWAMIEAIEISNPEGIHSLSAAMNNSERAVLRSLYEEWQRHAKWEGT